MKLSIVATLYQSEEYISEFISRASAAATKIAGDDYEIILVNDGSPDNSLGVARKYIEQTHNLTIIDLSRNFGHHKAMMTGLAHCSGENIFLLDSDLEEEPEWLYLFSQKLYEAQCDVVYGVQEQRKGKFFERLSGKWFYYIFNNLTGIKLPENIVTARLMSRRYVDALLRHQERELMIAGLWQITGFNQIPITVKKHSASQTTYTLKNKIALLVNSVTSFSNKPLYFIFNAGITISLIAMVYILYLMYRYFFLSTPPDGWTSVMASIWLLGGIIISFIGVVAIYISKIFAESKQRPYTIVRDVIKQSEKE